MNWKLFVAIALLVAAIVLLAILGERCDPRDAITIGHILMAGCRE